MLENYLALDDHDVFICIKGWAKSRDPILADLSSRFLNRTLFRTRFANKKERGVLREVVHSRTKEFLNKKGLPSDDHSASFYYDLNESYSEAYKYESESIWILEDGRAIEFSKAADTRHIIALTQPVVKPYLVHLKEIEI